jgi:hypothetical protein
MKIIIFVSSFGVINYINTTTTSILLVYIINILETALQTLFTDSVIVLLGH